MPITLKVTPEAASAIRKLKADLTEENNAVNVSLSETIIRAVKAYREANSRMEES